MTDPYSEAIVATVRGMSKGSPKAMLKRIQLELDDAGITDDVTEQDVVEAITTPDVNDPGRREFHIQVSQWDAAESPTWSLATGPKTHERRAAILEALGFGEESQEIINRVFPVDLTGDIIISDKPADWNPWFSSNSTDHQSFYWDGYQRVLESKGWDATAVSKLSTATDEVVKRLADPSRDDPYQSKGLVVGHVQSGKTANFTGVIAKAIDSGYKLVIVLTGTMELLRGQTQRRLDMELIGEENILQGVDRDDAELVAGIDYIGDGDIDWYEGRFVKYGTDPRTHGLPGIRRLTGAKDDYKLLKHALGYLDFRQTDHLVEPSRPLYDPLNIRRPDIRIAVVKKNALVLRKLVKDLQSTKTDLGEIPALIIDDEADQASINTIRPKKERAADPDAAKEARERTAINKLIAQLLGELRRAQYVGYTATPFANVFVEPDDAEDIFPKDFIVSLDPPADYMGGKDFHDLDRDEDDDATDVATSNQAAFVRDLIADQDDVEARDAEMLAALDAFVLAGAIKLHRAAALGNPKLFRHHTMLVHESQLKADHRGIAADIRRVWARAGYDMPLGMKRLHDLWIADFRPVTEARAPGEPIIADFSDLRPFIGQAYDKIQAGINPVVIVNGDKEQDYKQDDLNFQGGDVWKILVGGAKLSRGFTVEGLTISHYTRRTIAADTLMQMGRWFGYRPHYKDLVRLYIGRNVPAPRKQVIDLYKTFEGIVRDEEDFREELRRFQGFDSNGRPKVRPMDVPPLVYQSLPYMKPTSANKMYNAELTEQGEGGVLQDFPHQGEHNDERNEKHFALAKPLLDVATNVGKVFSIDDHGADKPYDARYGVIGAAELMDILSGFTWAENFRFTPTLRFMERAMNEGTLTDWTVIVPEISSLQKRTVDGRDIRVMRRARRNDRPWQFSGSSRRQRDVIEALSGGIDRATVDENGEVRAAFESRIYSHIRDLATPTRGAFLLTFAADSASARYRHPASDVTDPRLLPNPTQPKDIATLFSLALPLAAAPAGRIAFTVKRRDLENEPIVDSDGSD